LFGVEVGLGVECGSEELLGVLWIVLGFIIDCFVHRFGLVHHLGSFGYW
jgi:hypothetical protein